MKSTFLIALCFMMSYTTYGQGLFKKYFNSLLNDTLSAEKPKVMLFPTASFSPETNVELGINGLYVYKAKERKENRLSEITGFTFYTLKNQYGLNLDHAIYTDHDKYFLLGEFKVKSFPLKYYGIGSHAKPKELAIVNGIDFILKERILRRLGESVFTGLELGFVNLSKVTLDNNIINSFENQDEIIGLNGSTNVSVGWGFIYNNIHNILNARHGVYSEWAFLHSNKVWGSDYTFTNFFADNRFYHSVSERNVLAAQLFTRVGVGDVPFNQLSLMGGDRMMRGYYLGRFRDKTMIASQVEYRMLPFSFLKRWGMAFFLATANVSPSVKDVSLSGFKVAGGSGLRFLIFPKKDIFARIDVAFTDEGSAFYVRIGEVF